MIRDAGEYKRLVKESRENARFRPMRSLADELKSRVGDISGNMELGDHHMYRNRVELENDIVKAQELARYLLGHLQQAERNLDHSIKQHLVANPREAESNRLEERFKQQRKNFMAHSKPAFPIGREEAQEKAYHDAHEIIQHGSVFTAVDRYLEYVEIDEIAAESYQQKLRVFLADQSGGSRQGDMLFAIFQQVVDNDHRRVRVLQGPSEEDKASFAKEAEEILARHVQEIHAELSQTPTFAKIFGEDTKYEPGTANTSFKLAANTDGVNQSLGFSLSYEGPVVSTK